jgi:hypothetical protein
MALEAPRITRNKRRLSSIKGYFHSVVTEYLASRGHDAFARYIHIDKIRSEFIPTSVKGACIDPASRTELERGMLCE